jgi:tetratricopeptide (TPR) repeat protein
MSFGPAARAAVSEQRGLWIVAGGVLFAIGFLPLFAGPSYEFALACGVVLPLLGAAFNAARLPPLHAPLEAAFARGLLSGLGLCALSLCVALVHGLRAGVCDPASETAFFLLGPLPGALLACLWGAFCGAAFADDNAPKRARLAAVVSAVAAPLAGIVTSLLRYYTSPIIFAFDPFFGYFSGTLYDTVVDGVPRLLSYRAGTFGWIVALYALCGLAHRTPDGKLSLQLRARPLLAAWGLFGITLGLFVYVRGPELGHYQTDKSVQRQLGRAAQATRCKVIYAAGLRERDAHALARECDAHVEAAERYFETRAAPQITVYLFHSAEQKAWLMGARDVYIAKPWRNEIYIQARGYPHPVLGHELAHVVAAAFGQGPFRVAGPWGGWIPDPGRIEGVAVAASPRDDDDLTLLEWAKAMQELDLLPPLPSIFRLGFLGENSSKAYTVAGAFVSWLREVHGAAVVRAWYGGQALEALTQRSLEELELEFQSALADVTVSPEARAVAKARFDRPGVFARQCPHQVDKALAEAGAALGAFDRERARELYHDVLEMAPGEFWAVAGLGSCDVRDAKPDAAERRFTELLQPGAQGLPELSEPQRAWVEEQLGDLAYTSGRIEVARAHYTSALERVVDQDLRRVLSVKLRALGEFEPRQLATEAVAALLIGQPETGPNFSIAAAALARWSAASPKDGTADYLLGKGLAARGEWEQGALELDRALEKGLALPELFAEALRTRLFLACALGQKRVAEKALAAYLQKPVQSLARRQGVMRLAQRCEVPLPDGVNPKDSAPKKGALGE